MTQAVRIAPPYMPKIGEWVRIVEVHPGDLDPGAKVGDVHCVRYVLPYDPSSQFAGFLLLQCAGVVGATICLVESVRRTSTDAALERIGLAIDELMGASNG